MTTASASRAIFSIDPTTLGQFNALFAPRERSKAVERMMKAEVDAHRQQVLNAMRKIESDPRCASIAAVSADMDALSADLL